MEKSKVILRALAGETLAVPPIWMMRQAGRYLPEYRATRAKAGDFLSLCYNSDLATEVTLQPIQRYGFDASILFADILLLPQALGADLWFINGEGPRLSTIKDASDLSKLKGKDDIHEKLSPIYQTVKNLASALPNETTLIGFAGAPFTVASYLIEGGPSRSYQKTKAMMFSDKSLWDSLMERLTDITIESLVSQIEAGASAIQLFDSWAGSLSPEQYEHFVLPHSSKIFEALFEYSVPRIHFGVGTGEILHLMSAAGADVVGVDWRVPIDEARKRIGVGKAVQGNLDPSILGGDWELISEEVIDILERNAGQHGHIFNLGHGVTPEVNPDVLKRVVDLVHNFRTAS